MRKCAQGRVPWTLATLVPCRTARVAVKAGLSRLLRQPSCYCQQQGIPAGIHGNRRGNGAVLPHSPLAEAAETFCDALAVCHRAGAEDIVDETLLGLAAAEASRRDLTRAARLTGAAIGHQTKSRAVDEHDLVSPARRDPYAGTRALRSRALGPRRARGSGADDVRRDQPRARTRTIHSGGNHDHTSGTQLTGCWFSTKPPLCATSLGGHRAIATDELRQPRSGSALLLVVVDRGKSLARTLTATGPRRVGGGCRYFCAQRGWA
jgi:hypothetical protein